MTRATSRFDEDSGFSSFVVSFYSADAASTVECRVDGTVAANRWTQVGSDV
jgi:hypothetical protein